MSSTEHPKVNNSFWQRAGLSVICLAILVIFSTTGTIEAQTISQGPYTDYARAATGIDIYGSPKYWPAVAQRYGYQVSDAPVPGGVICITGGYYGTNSTYGFVGAVVYYQDNGAYWKVGVRYAYPTADNAYYHHAYVKEYGFQIAKNDPNVRYIYRDGKDERAGSYYLRPDYAGYNVVSEQYELGPDTKEATVYSKDRYVNAYLRKNYVVRIIAKAEAGETLWVFIESTNQQGIPYAKYYYDGKEQMKKFDAYAAEAYQMYYAAAYGDTVLDLGYADYSRIAGEDGVVTFTIKKGKDPRQLTTLQTIKVQFTK
jgi:hypothetical protein